ncbi:MAG: hypothetical protein FWF29_11360, partial [Treponema sp.]|nr:hypothetical protein [Treponema sp.]
MLSIRAKITAIIIGIAAVMIAISLGVGMVASQNRFIDTIEKTLISVSNIASGMLSSEINRAKEASLMISAQVSLTDEKNIPQLLDEIIKNSEKPDYMALSVVYRDGTILNSGENDAWLNANARNSEYGQRCFSGESIITTTSLTAEHNLVMRIWTPIDNDKALVASLPGLYLSQFISPYRMWQSGNIMVIDNNGMCIAGNKDYYRVLEQHNYIDWGERDPGYSEIGNAFHSILNNETGEGVVRFTLMG